MVGSMGMYVGNITNWGFSNATVRASVYKDPMSGALVYDPYIINNYLFGDCDVSVSSGTTYGIFGAARTGFIRRAYVYRAGRAEKKNDKGKILIPEEKDYVVPCIASTCSVKMTSTSSIVIIHAQRFIDVQQNTLPTSARLPRACIELTCGTSLIS